MRIPPAFALALLLPGCAGGQDALRTELQALREEVVRVRADNNILAARLEVLESTHAKRAARGSSGRDASPSPEDDRPSLDVVRLAPPSGGAEMTAEPAPLEPDEPPEPDEPRPILRSTPRGEVIAQESTPKAKSAGKARAIKAPGSTQSTSRTAP